MGAMASQITSLTIAYSSIYSGADERNYQSSASLAFVRGVHRWPVNSPRKWPVTRKMLDDVIMENTRSIESYSYLTGVVTGKMWGQLPNQNMISTQCNLCFAISNKSAKGAYTWSSPVCLSMCEGSEYTCLSVTKRKIILNVTISKLLVLVSMSGIWFGVYINNISALV